MTIEVNQKIDFQEIKNLLENNEYLLLELKGQVFTRDYIIKLQSQLPNYCVTHIKWKNNIRITPSISTNKVIENINEFYECIKLFDKTAHALLNLMAQTFDIDLKKREEIYDLKRNRSQRQRGKINEEWNYYFHGSECSFTNSRTNQFLDVKIIHGTEFGVIDTYYLMKFIQSTKSLEKMSSILNDDLNTMRKVIEILWINDFLTVLPNGNNNELILNRNKTISYIRE